MVPLVFVNPGYMLSEFDSPTTAPKVAILRILTGLMASLWLAEWALKGRFPFLSPRKVDRLWPRPSNWLRPLSVWLQAQPARWLVLAVWLYLGSTIISTVLSVSFAVSIWGDVPGQDGYPTYTVIAYAVLFGVIASHLKSRAQMYRLLGAIVIMGLLFSGYGVFQHYDLDFFNLNLSQTRDATAMAGNPIFAGAVMLMTTSISLAVAAVNLHESPRSTKFWWKLGIWSLVLTLQLLGVVFAFSRGPLLGTIIAVAGFVGLVTVFVGWRALARVAMVLGVAAVLTIVALYLPLLSDGDAADIAGDVASPSSVEDSAKVRAPPEVTEEIASIGIQVTRGGLSGRVEIWRNTWDIISHRRWFAFDDLNLSFLRPIVGYGPDLFRVTYLLKSKLEQPRLLPGEPDQAHNFFINLGFELGLLGLLAGLGLFLVPMLVGSYLLLRRRRDIPITYGLLLAGVLATLAGRFVEQMVGVARVSDMTLWWVVLALFVALPKAMGEHPETVEASERPGRPRRRRRRSAAGAPSESGRVLWRGVAATFMIIGILVLTWFQTVNYSRAAVMAAQVGQQFNQFDFQGALSSLDETIGLAPDVAAYYNLSAAVYRAYPFNSNVSPEQGCSLQRVSQTYGVCLATEAHAANAGGFKRRPYQFRRRLALADTALALGSLTGNAALVNQSVDLYRQTLEMMPHSWMLMNRLAEVYVQVGRPEAALPLLDESLSITGGTDYSAKAKVIRAMAYRGLGQRRKALEELNAAISAGIGGPRAYNERGVTYYDLGQYESSIKDYDQAIQLDPERAEAFVGRALANTQLGRDTEAEQDIVKAVERGFDGVVLRNAVERVRGLR
jgi:tetratricopeptide (TPR) repeat protein